jgi:hypothetical protein
MNLRRVPAAASVCACVVLGAWSPAAAPQAPAAAPIERQRSPGEGVLCAWALVSVVAEVGARCFPGQSPAMQSELHRSVNRLDAYVLKNGRDMTQAKVNDFKRQEGGVGAPTEGLCSGDPVELYRAFEKRGPEELRTMIDRAVERAGSPTFGTCT